jgi:hypothetical protein
MYLNSAILVYFVLLILTYLIARFVFFISNWSSIIVAVTIALIATAAICPMSSVDKSMENSPLLSFYMLIYVISIILILFYILDKSSRDISYF